jgi:hypothetical protein
VRIAVTSDIHGNCTAPDAVLVDLERQPAEVVARLRRLTCPVVMGNADAWLLTGEETGFERIPPERYRKMEAARAWSLSCLSAEDREFIAGFRPTVDVPLADGPNLLCFHGSPAPFDDLILPETTEEELRRHLGAHARHVLTGGHTHIQHVRHLGWSFYFNPGSVGFAYRHGQAEEAFRADPWAEYAVLSVDGGRMSLEFRRVPFDTAKLIRAYRESGRPFAEEAVAQYGD